MKPLEERLQEASEIIDKAMRLLPDYMDSPEARVMLLAIGLQESELHHRYQITIRSGKRAKGPARGLWQFERGGGVRGVLVHWETAGLAIGLCGDRMVDLPTLAVWRALEHDDVLAAGFARLLLYTDPLALPGVDADDHAWEYYLRLWRPGKPKYEKWPGNHKAAREFVLRKDGEVKP